MDARDERESGPRVARTRVLPARGRALISADLHGNFHDFAALHRRFEALRAGGEEVHWVLLGDLVHGPSPAARARRPAILDYDDASPELVEAVLELRRQHPEHVHVLLGNHDHGHVGGVHTQKFYEDEVVNLEIRCTRAQRAAIRELFAGALLSALAPCGLLLAHGCPDDHIREYRDLDAVDLRFEANEPYLRHLLATFTRSYGQRAEVTRRLLAQISENVAPVQVMVHGHDVDEAGWYSEGEHQLSAVIFGAPPAAKRYLEVDLGGHYGGASALREGVEIRRIHGGDPDVPAAP
ncbi:MAG: metallophosphoesterase [Nannocystaceae bacterium]